MRGVLVHKRKDAVRWFVTGVMALGLVLLRSNLTAGPVTIVQAEGASSAQDAAYAIPSSNPYDDSTQCTYRAWELAAQAGHKLPWFPGNATDWRQGALNDGLYVVDKLDPSVVNSVAVWHSYVGGAGVYGHVAWVTAVSGDWFQVQERNWFSTGADDTRWVQWQQGISFIIFAQPSDLQLTQPLTIDDPNPQTGQVVNVQFTIQNVGQLPIALQNLVAGVRQGSDFTGDPQDFPADAITLQPGQEYTYQATRSFSQSGDYVAQAMMYMQDYGWVPVNDADGNTPRLSFSVQEPPTPQPTAPPTATPTVQPEATGQFMHGALRAISLPASATGAYESPTATPTVQPTTQPTDQLTAQPGTTGQFMQDTLRVISVP